MKLRFFLAALLAVTLCCAVALAEEVPAVDEAVMLHDPAAFDAIAQQTNWHVPDGYTLEAFLQTDVSADGAQDVIASLLAADGAQRALAVIVSDKTGHYVHTSTKALPPKDVSMEGGDPFMGFSAYDGYMNIHLGGGEDARDTDVYSFGVYEHGVYLDAVYVSRWDPNGQTVTENIFDLTEGTYTSLSGHMEGEAFIAEATLDQRQFDPGKAVLTLEAFDYSAFPLDWNAFSLWLEFRAMPTAKPSRRPAPTVRPTVRPTSSAMPGPVYPTDMPGPVYPTDMPGPVYPTDMPGPVYPTDMPGPVYPTPTPEPTDMPGPIDWETENVADLGGE